MKLEKMIEKIETKLNSSNMLQLKKLLFIWSRTFEELYLELDLSDLLLINCIVITQRFDYDRIKGYRLQYASEEGKWEDLYEYSGDLIGNNPINHSFRPVWARYVRLLITETQIKYGFSEPGIQSFEVYYFLEV